MSSKVRSFSPPFTRKTAGRKSGCPRVAFSAPLVGEITMNGFVLGEFEMEGCPKDIALLDKDRQAVAAG